MKKLHSDPATIGDVKQEVGCSVWFVMVLLFAVTYFLMDFDARIYRLEQALHVSGPVEWGRSK